MTLLKKFYDYATSAGFSKEDILEEKGDGFSLVSFFEEGEKDVLYNVALVFYEDDTTEVYIRKQLENADLFEVLKKLNNLNSEYCGVTFLYDDEMLTVKSHCKTEGDLSIALKEMVQNMQLAKKEFKDIK